MSTKIFQPQISINSMVRGVHMVMHPDVDESPLWFADQADAIAALQAFAGFIVTRTGKHHEAELNGARYEADSLGGVLTPVFDAVAGM